MNVRTHLRYIASLFLGVLIASGWWASARWVFTVDDMTQLPPTMRLLIVITAILSILAVGWAAFILFQILSSDKDEI